MLKGRITQLLSHTLPAHLGWRACVLDVEDSCLLIDRVLQDGRVHEYGARLVPSVEAAACR